MELVFVSKYEMSIHEYILGKYENFHYFTTSLILFYFKLFFIYLFMYFVLLLFHTCFGNINVWFQRQ